MCKRIRLEHVSEFKYLECVLDESGTDEAECSRKVVSLRKVAGAIRSVGHTRSLLLESTRDFHESLLVPVITSGCYTMIWRKKDLACTDRQPQRFAGYQENG